MGTSCSMLAFVVFGFDCSSTSGQTGFARLYLSMFNEEKVIDKSRKNFSRLVSEQSRFALLASVSGPDLNAHKFSNARIFPPTQFTGTLINQPRLDSAQLSLFPRRMRKIMSARVDSRSGRADKNQRIENGKGSEHGKQSASLYASRIAFDTEPPVYNLWFDDKKCCLLSLPLFLRIIFA